MTPASAQCLTPAQVRFQWPWENFTRSLTNCSKSTRLEKNQPYHPLSKTNTVYEIPRLISLNHLTLNSPVHSLSPDIKVLSVFIRTLGFHSPFSPVSTTPTACIWATVYVRITANKLWAGFPSSGFPGLPISSRPRQYYHPSHTEPMFKFSSDPFCIMSSPVRSLTLSLASDKLHIPTPFYFSNLTSHHRSRRASVWATASPVLPPRCAHACPFITRWDQLPILCGPGSTTNPTEPKAFLKNLTTIHTASISFVISSKYVPNQNALRLSLPTSFFSRSTYKLCVMAVHVSLG